MDILILCPIINALETGLYTTARRWETIFRQLGHNVRIASPSDAVTETDILVALNPVRCSSYLEDLPLSETPLIVVLTGTDIYNELKKKPNFYRHLESARVLIGLHPGITEEVPERYRSKLRVIVQSAPNQKSRPQNNILYGQAIFIANLRYFKRPMTVFAAACALNENVNINITHIGDIVDDEYHFWSQPEFHKTVPRYNWLGAKTREDTASALASSDVMLIASSTEGGSNVQSEAISAGVPIISSRNRCVESLLGSDYPGLFDTDNHHQLACLIEKFFVDHSFRELLKSNVSRASYQFSYDLEVEKWKNVIQEIT